jgi:hypothetical protein
MAHIRWIEDHGLYQWVHVLLDNPYTQVIPGPYGDTMYTSPYARVFCGHIQNQLDYPCETAAYIADEHGEIVLHGEPAVILYRDDVAGAVRFMGEELV